MNDKRLWCCLICLLVAVATTSNNTLNGIDPTLPETSIEKPTQQGKQDFGTLLKQVEQKLAVLKMLNDRQNKKFSGHSELKLKN